MTSEALRDLDAVPPMFGYAVRVIPVPAPVVVGAEGVRRAPSGAPAWALVAGPRALLLVATR